VGGKYFDIKVLIEIPVEAWIEDARGGSPHSLGMALEACRAYLEKIAEAELASDLRPKGDVSDLVQETFLEAARDFRQFTGCTGPEWQAWLRQIFIHNLQHLVERYRTTGKRKLNQEVPLGQVVGGDFGNGDLAGDYSSPSAHVMKKELGEIVHVAMSGLSERDRQLLIWRFHDQCTYEEMGRRLGCTGGGAKKAWLKAIDRVREIIDWSTTPA